MDTAINLEELTDAPYIFYLNDKTELGLGDWTLDAEKWAKKNFGSMENLFNALLNIGVDNETTIDAAVRVAAYKLTDDSYSSIKHRIKPDENLVEFLARNLTYKQLAVLCNAEYQMIRNSIPLELVKKTQEALAMIQTQGKTSKKKASKKKTKTR